MVTELRFAWRRLQRNPGFAITVLLTLGLCLGANLVIFAVVDSVLLRPLPFPDSDRLAIALHSYPGAGVERSGCSLPNYRDWQKAVPAFLSLSASKPGNVVVGDAGAPSRVAVERVTPEFFTTLGVQPARGSFFQADSAASGPNQTVVITDSYWRSHMNTDPGVIGRTLRADGQTATVIGVLPASFRYLSSRAELYFPLIPRADELIPEYRHSDNVQLIARLAPGATLAAAQAQIDAFDALQLKDDPYAEQLKSAHSRTWIRALQADHVRQVRPTLLLLQGGALTLLLIGGGNLINLFLVRASSRAKEFAVRLALGAGRRHVVREVLVETVLLAAGGGLLGLALGAAGIDLLAYLGGTQLPAGAAVHFSARLAFAAVAGSAVAGAGLAAPIVWLNLRGNLHDALQSEARGGSAGRAAQRLRHGFIVAQMALAFVLLAGAGLLGLSLQRVLSQPTGFQPENVLTAQIGLTSAAYGDEKSRLAFNERLINELRSQPGIVAAASATTPPFSGEGEKTIITVEGHEPLPGESVRGHYVCSEAGDFWQALGIPLREGRFLRDADNQTDSKVCVVDEVFARRYWPQGGAIGKRLVKDANFKANDALTIVGVVGQVKQSDLADTAALGTVYRPYRYDVAENFYIVLRSSLPAHALAASLQKTVQHLDPDLPVQDIQTMQERIDASLVQRRSPALLAVIFAAVSLLLVVLGTYGVIAFNVLQRRQEVGIRIALGAQRTDVVGLVLKQGVSLAAVGAGLGLIGSLAMGKLLQGILFGISSRDPIMLASVGLGLLAVAALACWIPARRAARVDPMLVLRGE